MPIRSVGIPSVISDKLEVLPENRHHLIRLGNIPDTDLIFKQGEKTNILTTDFKIIDGGTGTQDILEHFSQESRAKVVSSDANDADGGTGINKVHMDYLDSNWEVKEAFATLNGTTAVDVVDKDGNVVTDILHIVYMLSLKVGSLGEAAGDIDLQDEDLTNIYARIPTGLNSWNAAIYHVPKGYRAHVLSWTPSAYLGGVRFVLEAEVDKSLKYPKKDYPQAAGANRNYQIVESMLLESSPFYQPLRNHFPVAEKMHVRIRCKGEVTGLDATASFLVIEEKV